MSMLARATRGLKGIDQEAMASLPGTVYIPLENRQTWTAGSLTDHDSALNIATFYACVRVLAESVASLPLLLYRNLEGGGKQRAPDHELYSVFHDAPNPSMTSFVWRELMMSHLSAWGNAYNEITYDGLGRMQLWPIRPDRIEPRWGPGNAKLFDYLSPTGHRKTLAPETVFHIPGLSPDGLRGYSPVSLHRRTLETHNAAREFGRNFFKNGARPGFVLTHKKTLSDPAIDRLAAQMEQLRGSGNAGKTVVLEEDTGLHEIGVPPEDAQYIQTRVFEAREIQKIFRMPPHKVGDLERATFSNIEHQSIEFVVDTLRPWLVRIEQEIKAQLLPGSDVFAEFLVDGLLRGDSLARAQSLQVQRQNGVINGDEWREIENRNPIEDGSGQEFWMPVNFQAAVTDQPEVPDAGAPPALFAVKSAAVRCLKCNRLLAEAAAPPYRITCGRCKTVTEADEVAEPVKSVDPMMVMATAMTTLASREQPTPEIHVDARQEPPVVNVTVPPAEPAAPAQVTVNVPEQPPSTVNVRMPNAKPSRKRLVRDDANNVIEIIEELA